MSGECAILAAAVLLLAVRCLLSLVMAALTGASRSRLQELADEGDAGAQRALDLLARREAVVAALLLGKSLGTIVVTALATALFVSWFGAIGLLYAIPATALLIVLFAEVLPRTFGAHWADWLARHLARPAGWALALLAPLTRLLDGAVQGTLGLFGVSLAKSEAEREERAEEELRGAIEQHSNAEEPAERAMLRSILDLAEVEVSEIMTHRRDVVAIDADLPAEEIVRQVLDSPFTRIPLWRGNPDEIVGVLHAKRLLRALQGHQATPALDVLAVAQSPWFIPDTTDLQQQLHAFRARHEHFALVVDEYGAFLGIVTLEDILEEIVGDIADENDEAIEGVKIEDDGSYVIDGRVTLRDLNRQFGWRLPDEEANTLAGLVLHEARMIPEIGQVFTFHGFRFEILGRQRHQITKIRAQPLAEPAAGEETAAGEGSAPAA